MPPGNAGAVVEVSDRKPDICREILRDLPEWFGIPAATAAYVEAASSLTMLALYDAGDPVGFVSLKTQSLVAVAIHALEHDAEKSARVFGRHHALRYWNRSRSCLWIGSIQRHRDLGVRRSYHRTGIGRRLIEAAARKTRDEGMMFMTVKTIADSSPDVHFASTRRFYAAMGFLPLEVFPTLWGSSNPCLMLIKPLRTMPHDT